MAAKFKQKCSKCRKNYVLATWRSRYILCYDCQKLEMDKEIKDPKMKKMFNLPEEYYKKNPFFGNIKVAYLRWGNLTEKQIEAFKKAVIEMKESS